MPDSPQLALVAIAAKEALADTAAVVLDRKFHYPCVIDKFGLLLLQAGTLSGAQAVCLSQEIQEDQLLSWVQRVHDHILAWKLDIELFSSCAWWI